MAGSVKDSRFDFVLDGRVDSGWVEKTESD